MYFFIQKLKYWAGRVAQLIECLPRKPSKPSKHEALRSNPNTLKKKTRNQKNLSVYFTHATGQSQILQIFTEQILYTVPLVPS
jgi:hypothetical protein